MEFEEPQTHRPEGRQSVGATVRPQVVLCIAASIFYPAFSWGTASCASVWCGCVDTDVWRGQRTSSMMFLGLHSSGLFFFRLSHFDLEITAHTPGTCLCHLCGGL